MRIFDPRARWRYASSAVRVLSRFASHRATKNKDKPAVHSDDEDDNEKQACRHRGVPRQIQYPRDNNRTCRRMIACHGADWRDWRRWGNKDNTGHANGPCLLGVGWRGWTGQHARPPRSLERLTKFSPLRENVLPSHIFLPPPSGLAAASRLTHERQLEVTQQTTIPPSSFHLPVARGQRLDLAATTQ